MNETLELWGVLDSRLFSTLSKEEQKEFLTRDANDLLPKLVKLSPVLTDAQRREAMQKEYDVTVGYKLIGQYYSNQGTVKAEMLYSEEKGARLISYIILDKN